MFYVVMDIGCIECYEDSKVLGIFTNIEKAESIRDKYCEKYTIETDKWHGEHNFEIFEVDEIDNEHK